MNRTHSLGAAAVLVLVPALVLTACADGEDAPAARTPPAGDPDVLVLQVAYTGGFTGPGELAGRLPLVSVYADGRVLSQGPTAAVYPGPAWPEVQLQRTDPATVQRLADDALAAGVGGSDDLGRPAIADAPSTRFTVTTAGRTSQREVYALTEGEGSPGLTADQQAARGALLDLFTELTDLPATLPVPSPGSYRPTAVAVLAQVAGPPPEPAQAELPWPGPALPGDSVAPGVGCVLITGEQLPPVVDAARGATALTPWRTDDGGRWQLGFRPLLPHETGCADLAG